MPQLLKRPMREVLLLGVFVAAIGADVQCPAAVEARPSLENLQAQIDALTAEVDSLAVVIDGAGKLVGDAVPVFSDTAAAFAQLDLPGVPVFVVEVDGAEIDEQCRDTVEFETDDCTGQAWVDSSGRKSAWGKVVTTTDASGGSRLFYVGDPADGPHPIVIRSTDACGRGCQSGPNGNDTGFPAVPVDLDSMFAPPFLVVTRGDL